MSRTIVALLFAVLAASAAPRSTTAATAPCPPTLDHKFTDLMDEPLSLCQHAGKVILIVNEPALRCTVRQGPKSLPALRRRAATTGSVAYAARR